MGSSGDDNSMPIQQNATPAPGLPVAGQGGGTGSPYDYGQYQNFLPDAQASGQNPMATGLRPDMFKFRGPGGGPNPQLQGQQGNTLREALSTLLAGRGGAGANPAVGGG
jgi:hypothetical protein